MYLSGGSRSVSDVMDVARAIPDNTIKRFDIKSKPDTIIHMGSSNLNCAISGFPINQEERVYCIFLVKSAKHSKEPYYPWGDWKFGSLPFMVEMGDYCSPMGMLDCEGSKSGQFDTFNELDKFIYDTFRSKIHCYKVDEKNVPYPILTKPKEERNSWYHIMRYGNYDDIEVGYSHYFKPSKPDENKNIAWLKRFDPNGISVMFINEKVFKYMTRKLKPAKYSNGEKDRMETWFDNLDKYVAENQTMIDNLKKLTAEGKTYENSQEYKDLSFAHYGLIHNLDLNQFEFLSYNSFRTLVEQLRNNSLTKEFIDGIKLKLRLLYRMGIHMDNAQQKIVPSHGLSGQGGWYNGTEDIRAFHAELIKIYDARRKRMKAEGF